MRQFILSKLFKLILTAILVVVFLGHFLAPTSFAVGSNIVSEANSVISINGKQAARIKAEIVEKSLIIEIHPLKGWGIPNRASLVEMEHLKMEPAPVGELILGYDEDVSVDRNDIRMRYQYENKGAFIISAEIEDFGILKPIINDLRGELHIPFTGTIDYLFGEPFTDLSTPPESDFLTDNNKYDQYMITWPDQTVKFGGELFARGYVDHPNYVWIQIPLDFETDKKREIHVYLRLLIDSLREIFGRIIGDGIFRYVSIELVVPIAISHPLGDTPWAMFQHDPQHTGHSYHRGPQDNKLLWTYQAGASFSSHSPAIGHDGTVYIGSSDHHFYAINSDGRLRWSHKINEQIGSSPAIDSDGNIYVGSHDGMFYAFKANGTIKWRLQLAKEYISKSPCFYITIDHSNTVYVSYYSKRIVKGQGYYSDSYRLSAIDPDGIIKWTYEPNCKGGSAPIVDKDGTIYISLDDPIYKVYAINPDGSTKWSSEEYVDDIAHTAIGEDGTIYVGTHYKLYAMDTFGKVKWERSIKDKACRLIDGIAISRDGTVYLSTGSHKDNYGILFAFTFKGKFKWSYKTVEAISQIGEITPPSIDVDGKIYIGATNGHVYALNSLGHLEWEYRTKSIIYSTPTISSNGRIYVADVLGKLYAIGSQ